MSAMDHVAPMLMDCLVYALTMPISPFSSMDCNFQHDKSIIQTHIHNSRLYKGKNFYWAVAVDGEEGRLVFTIGKLRRLSNMPLKLRISLLNPCTAGES